MAIQKHRAIVIRTTPFSETSVVLTCFTDKLGIQTYLINGVRSGKGAIRPSHLLPLNLLELDAYHQQNKNMQRIKELKCIPVLHDLHFNMLKSAIALFIAEVLSRLIKEEDHTDSNTFEFLFSSIQMLDVMHDGVANFPITFLSHFTRYMGFYPKLNFSAVNNAFHLQEGEFMPYHAGEIHMMNETDSHSLYQVLCRDVASSAQLKIDYESRKRILEHLLDYYRLHVQGQFDIQSHHILHEVLV
jgi:DNA repair protein RecO (recombination protein O)